MRNVKYLIVTDKPDVFEENLGWQVMTPEAFIALPFSSMKLKKMPKVINLSGRYGYQKKGYYVSLLAEARGLACIPNMSNILTLEWKRHYDFALSELNELLAKHYKSPPEEPLTRIYTSFFGRHSNPQIEPVSRRLFDLFRYPALSFEVKYTQQDKWIISKIDSVSFSALTKPQLKDFHGSLNKFTGAAWRAEKGKKHERYWIAILQDPNEVSPPSNKAALKKFIAVGKKMNLWIELITKSDFSSLLEYDALFIRETTSINSHTYRFAHKAELEGIPCIDDTQSIIRCCNKVFLKEVLEFHKIPIPQTMILDKQNLKDMKGQIKYPAVLKVPDSEFSKGVIKVNAPDELITQAGQMLQRSDIVLCQEYVPSAYDWRIGILGGDVLFASKYYMAKDHWQIYNNSAKSKKDKEGADESVPITEVPKPVLDVALAAAKAVGNGLYGVDIKDMGDGRVLVIEVNDNPNIDAGVEDKIMGESLYQKVLQHIVTRIEAEG